MIDVRPLEAKHALAVARLHQAGLTTGFCGAAGRHLLAAYYRSLISGSGGCGYVALVDGRVDGFICGLWDEAAVRRQLLRGEWAALAGWGALYALGRPVALAKRLLSGSHGSASLPAGGYELRPIVVTNAAKGSGMAAALTNRLIEDARSRGFKQMHLYTEAHNRRAQAFYAKMCFTQAGEYATAGDVLLRFERDL